MFTEHNKSAISDHAIQENHVIDWAKTTVIAREFHRPTKWIKESVHIRKEDQQAINRAAINSSICTTAFLKRRLSVVSRSRRTKYQLSFGEGLSERSKRRGFHHFDCVI